MIFRPHYLPGATPLDPDEVNGLIPDFITTQMELNALEQENILNGKNWALKTKKEVLDEGFVRELHKKMYCDIWKWAGTYRTSLKNPGIDPNQISTQLYSLMKDVNSWIEFGSYSWTEILARFHHRLVYIHPFANGNGRYSRLHTELLAERNNQNVPTWGASKFRGDINQVSEIRTQYITTLKAADAKNINPLKDFLYS